MDIVLRCHTAAQSEERDGCGGGVFVALLPPACSCSLGLHCRTSDSEILLSPPGSAIVKYCRELLFIESQYTYEQPQTNFMYMRGSISFLHHHEVKNPGNRSRREILLYLFGITYRCYYKPSPPSSTNYTSVLKYVILTAPINFFYPKSALLCDSQ